FRYTTKRMISAIPGCQVLAKLNQLYMVEYQCASILISQNHGVTDIAVKANNTIYRAAQTVVRKTYLLFSSLVSRGFSSSSSEILLIFHPSRDQPPMVRIVHTVKNPEFRNPLLPLMMASVSRVCLSVQ